MVPKGLAIPMCKGTHRMLMTAHGKAYIVKLENVILKEESTGFMFLLEIKEMKGLTYEG